MAKETCNQVDQFCTAPPALKPKVYTRKECYSCGLPVCANCSFKVVYHDYGRQRLCHSCLEEYDGKDARVMAHLYELAGIESRTNEHVGVRQLPV